MCGYEDLVIDRRAQCPYCRSSNIDKRAIVEQNNGTHKQLTFCDDCHKAWRIIYDKDKKGIIDIDYIGDCDDSLYHIM